jgi:methylenetetrahydrofolate reductase (NADPH)
MAPPAAALLQGYSIEVTARDTAAAEICASVLRPGTEVTIAFTRASTHAAVVGIAGELRAAGFRPVPHLVARSFLNYTQFADLLARLHDVGVDAALVVGGDQDRAAGPFHSALDLLRTGALTWRGFRRVGLACYPEPHRRIDQAKLDSALADKLDAIVADGMTPWLISQFCLDAAPIVALAQRLRARGIAAPLRIGIAGPADRRTLWKYALSCGIGASIRALGAHADVLRDLLTRDTPDALVSELVTRLAACGELGIAGVHIFSFGGVAGAAQWANALLTGR